MYVGWSVDYYLTNAFIVRLGQNYFLAAGAGSIPAFENLGSGRVQPWPFGDTGATDISILSGSAPRRVSFTGPLLRRASLTVGCAVCIIDYPDQLR